MYVYVKQHKVYTIFLKGISIFPNGIFGVSIFSGLIIPSDFLFMCRRKKNVKTSLSAKRLVHKKKDKNPCFSLIHLVREVWRPPLWTSIWRPPLPVFENCWCAFKKVSELSISAQQYLTFNSQRRRVREEKNGDRERRIQVWNKENKGDLCDLLVNKYH